MVPARSVDCGEIYELKRRELVELLRSLSTGELAITVPATPEWSVRDVLCHVVGIAADLNARNFGAETLINGPQRRSNSGVTTRSPTSPTSGIEKPRRLN